jgi:hypothetical protein
MRWLLDAAPGPHDGTVQHPAATGHRRQAGYSLRDIAGKSHAAAIAIVVKSAGPVVAALAERPGELR